MTLTANELIERMTRAMRHWSGDDLAALYNREFGDGMEYVGDNVFEQKGKIERDCMNCEETFVTTDSENHDCCPRCRANPNR